MSTVNMDHYLHHHSTNAAPSLHADEEWVSPYLVVADRQQAHAYCFNVRLLQDDALRGYPLQRCFVSTHLSPCFEHTGGCSCTPQNLAHPK